MLSDKVKVTGWSKYPDLLGSFVGFLKARPAQMQLQAASQASQRPLNRPRQRNRPKSQRKMNSAPGQVKMKLSQGFVIVLKDGFSMRNSEDVS
jgi:hypothetical protein